MVRIVKPEYVHLFTNVAQIVPISGDEIIRRAELEGMNPLDWMEERTMPYEKDYYLVTGITRDHVAYTSCCPKMVKGGEYQTIRIIAVSPEDAEATALKASNLGKILVVRREFGYPAMETIDSGAQG